MVDEQPNVTSVEDWKRDSAATGAALKELHVPSGKTALVRAPGLQAFMAMGFVPNSLMAIIKDQLDKNSGKNKMSAAAEKKLMSEMWDTITNDPQKLQDMFGLVDKCVVYCVNKPPVHPVPMKTITVEEDGEVIEKLVPDDDARDPNKLYVDEVDLEDKFFIFNFACGGTRDYEQFRNERSAVMDSTSSSKTVVKPTKRTNKPKTAKRK